MAKKDFTATSKLLMYLLTLGDVLEYAIGTPYGIQKRWEGKPSSLRTTLWYLHKRGIIKIVDKNNQRFIKLTKKGQLEALFEKARLEQSSSSWDGKWRLIIFDIPEESHAKRDQLRHLLRKYGYYKLQASVFISPYPINRTAIAYLRESKLIEYIRIAKIEEIDNDTDLRKIFKLPKLRR